MAPDKHSRSLSQTVMSWFGRASTTSLAPQQQAAALTTLSTSPSMVSLASQTSSLYTLPSLLPDQVDDKFTGYMDDRLPGSCSDDLAPPYPPVTMIYEHAQAKRVYITGDFDQWTASVRMERAPGSSSTFHATLHLDPTKTHVYKFVVDGCWAIDPARPYRQDNQGNVNNILYSTK
ncbi:hypothetical protein DM01DRAFT_1403462 [Hesseltinella vesiculosa]|uniref:AMP-activated protein kinase glycogen-binding domain-containing protein n=1 Tax=Hesseltinella vesiculosa TaxID=101127 RepID=A0A1X2GYI2_9FUNG|nr:hypothetical protein DM01DRAFT_1403462 [Hesseltinella vesiculosa]